MGERFTWEVNEIGGKDFSILWGRRHGEEVLGR